MCVASPRALNVAQRRRRTLFVCPAAEICTLCRAIRSLFTHCSLLFAHSHLSDPFETRVLTCCAGDGMAWPARRLKPRSRVPHTTLFCDAAGTRCTTAICPQAENTTPAFAYCMRDGALCAARASDASRLFLPASLSRGCRRSERCSLPLCCCTLLYLLSITWWRRDLLRRTDSVVQKEKQRLPESLPPPPTHTSLSGGRASATHPTPTSRDTKQTTKAAKITILAAFSSSFFAFSFFFFFAMHRLTSRL